MNRVEDYIARAQKRIDAFGGESGMGMNGKPIASLHETNALTLADFLAFQNLQASAHVMGRITTEEAMTVYHALGGEAFIGDWPKGTSLATKIAITRLMGELLE